MITLIFDTLVVVCLTKDRRMGIWGWGVLQKQNCHYPDGATYA